MHLVLVKYSVVIINSEINKVNLYCKWNQLFFKCRNMKQNYTFIFLHNIFHTSLYYMQIYVPQLPNILYIAPSLLLSFSLIVSPCHYLSIFIIVYFSLTHSLVCSINSVYLHLYKHIRSLSKRENTFFYLKLCEWCITSL